MKKNSILISIGLIVTIGVLIVLQRLLVTNNNAPTNPIPLSPTTFQAQGNTKVLPQVESNSAPKNAIPTEEAYEKIYRPDLFISNKAPYQNEYFAVTYTFKTQPSGHFAFTVQLKNDRTKAQQEFTSWLAAQGLTNTQIATLDITYTF